jgi:predicted transcriptional regulator
MVHELVVKLIKLVMRLFFPNDHVSIIIMDKLCEVNRIRDDVLSEKLQIPTQLVYKSLQNLCTKHFFIKCEQRKEIKNTGFGSGMGFRCVLLFIMKY